MIIFASDLDGTLIFSDRYCQGLSDELVIVDHYKEKPTSYMTQRLLTMLRLVEQQTLFIPATTRTIEQYRRIQLFQNEIKPTYAIVSNGGFILKNNGIDENWSRIVQNEIQKIMPASEVLIKLQKLIREDWVPDMKIRSGDDLFYYLIVDRKKIPADELANFETWAKANQWTISLQGRKLYLVPDCIDKSLALRYILKDESFSKLFAAGDSLLDLKMLRMADNSLVPAHGELFDSNTLNSMNLSFTSASGLAAGVEILSSVLRKIVVNSD